MVLMVDSSGLRHIRCFWLVVGSSTWLEGGFSGCLNGSVWFWGLSSWFLVVLVVILGVYGVVLDDYGLVLSTIWPISCTSLAESSEPSSSRRSPCVVLALPHPPPPAESSSGATGRSNSSVKLRELN